MNPAANPPPQASIPTKTLVEQAAGGDEEAIGVICERFRPRLAAWARGRLPDYARDLLDTQDLIQEALVSSLRRLPVFENREAGSFLQYIKTSILNRIRNEIRRTHRRGRHSELNDEVADSAPTPMEEYLRKETEQRYNDALAMLTSEEQELVIARIELQMTAHEIAIHTGRPSPGAARMAARRAILKLATLMRPATASP